MTNRSKATTHADDCWSWGPGHYDCAVREIERLREQLRLATVDQAIAEPVAYGIKAVNTGKISTLVLAGSSEADELGEYRHEHVVPLYAAPPAAKAEDDDARDAARYRWLRKGESDDIAVVRGLGAMDYGMSAVAYTYSEEIDSDDLDAAIDAAMEGEK